MAAGIIEQWRNANAALRLITTPAMAKLRRESLNVSQHWLFYVSSRKPYPESLWIDLLYEQADTPPQKRAVPLLN